MIVVVGNTGSIDVQVMDTKTNQAQANAENAQQNKKQRKTVSDLHPKYSQMISEAITSLKERNGSSRQAILKYILTSYNVSTDKKLVNNHVKMSLKAGVKSGKLKQSKGSGACGSYKLGKNISKKAPKQNHSGSNSQVKKASLTKVKKPQDVTKISKASAKKTISNSTSVKTKPSAKKAFSNKTSTKSGKTKSSAKKSTSNKSSRSTSQKSKSSTKNTVKAQKIEKQTKREKAVRNPKKSSKSNETPTKTKSQMHAKAVVA